MQDITAVIPYFNGNLDALIKLVKTVSEHMPVVIVDDHSDFILQDIVGEVFLDNVSIVRPEKKGYFSGAVNFGIEFSEEDVLVLNQDIELDDNQWIDCIGSWKTMDYGIAGDGVFGHPAWNNGYVQGTFMYMSRKAIDAIGMLNAELYPLWGSTCEWQLRACRNGFQVNPEKLTWLKHRVGKKQQFGDAIQTVLEREPERKSVFITTPPLISVIIPCHNYGNYLEDAVNSLIGGRTSLGVVKPQTLQSFEVVIIDDASIDDSWEICQSLQNEWKGIRALRNIKNLGTAETINVGVCNSYGKYITVLSADDMRQSEALEKLYSAIIGTEKTFTYDDIQVFGGGRYQRILSMGSFDEIKILTRNNIHAGILYPRNAFVEIGGYPSVMKDGREDWAFNVGLVSKGYRGIYVQFPGYLYRREGQNRSNLQRSRDYFLSKIRKSYPETYETKGAIEMACCGGSRGSKPVISNSIDYHNLVGKDGFTLMEYTGKSYGTQPWYGLATNTCYMFGLSKPIGYVDNRDVPGLLEIMEAKNHVFRIYQDEKSSSKPKESNSDNMIDTMDDKHKDNNEAELSIAGNSKRFLRKKRDKHNANDV